jgi:hypothetical protein
MTTRFRILKGLPAYGPLAIPFPEEYGRTGQEGLVVEFRPDSGRWVGNFRRGRAGYNGVHRWPGSDTLILVVAGGHAYWVDPRARALTGHEDWVADDLWEVSDPDGFVVNRQGLAAFRVGSSGVIWHTRRISLAGFQELEMSATVLRGLADVTAQGNGLVPFEVDLRTGISRGGWEHPWAFDPDWEQLYVPDS